ncbi:MAG TPA: hypothetical protein VKA46_31500 [Gemmataceae bacterium]|nr:hypothetical protein [Gemmataceae bacterium]
MLERRARVSRLLSVAFGGAVNILASHEVSMRGLAFSVCLGALILLAIGCSKNAEEAGTPLKGKLDTALAIKEGATREDARANAPPIVWEAPCCIQVCFLAESSLIGFFRGRPSDFPLPSESARLEVWKLEAKKFGRNRSPALT